MKKIQIWITLIFFCISFFSTVTAEESPEDIFSENVKNNQEINLNSLKIHLAKARIFIKNSKDDKALLELEKILEVDPTNQTALELKEQIIGEPVELAQEVALDIEPKEPDPVEIDYMQIAKENWLILAVLFGSFFAIIFILIFSKRNKKDSDDLDMDLSPSSKSKEDKDVFADLEDVF